VVLGGVTDDLESRAFLGSAGREGSQEARAIPATPVQRGTRAALDFPVKRGTRGTLATTDRRATKETKATLAMMGSQARRETRGTKATPVPLWPDVFVVSPGATAPFYASVQAAIDAAVSGGERTESDPAQVLILPGDYTEDVSLKKHVALLGLDRLGHFTTNLRGQVTCSLMLEGGVREKTFATIAGINILPPAGKTAGIYFTGANSQKLILTDVAIEGSVPSVLADNTFTSGTGTSQILITDCRLRSTSTLFPALRVKSGSVEAFRVDLWNRPPVGATTSPTVIHLGPSIAQSQTCTVALSDCNIEGNVQIDSSLSTSAVAGSLGLSMLRCTQFILNTTAAPIRFVIVTPNATAGVTALGVVLSVFRATAWTSGTAMIFGNPGGAIPVINRLNSFRADTGITVASLTGGTATNTVMGSV
jgi:hypothetical protein